MQIIFVTLIYFLIGGSCIYFLLCVDSNDPGILGKMNRLVFSICPDFFKLIPFLSNFLPPSLFQENMLPKSLEKDS